MIHFIWLIDQKSKTENKKKGNDGGSITGRLDEKEKRNTIFRTNKIAETIGVKAPKRKIPSPIVRIYGALNSIFAKILRYYPKVTGKLSILGTEVHFYSSAKAIKKLNMPQTPIELSIKECFEWFKKNDMLKPK